MMSFQSAPSATERNSFTSVCGSTPVETIDERDALVVLLVLGLGVTAYAARAHLSSEEDPVVRMAKLLVATCFSALVSVVFLGLLVLATALPAYAKLMQR